MTDSRLHDVTIRADLAFVDAHWALDELKTLVPFLDPDYLRIMVDKCDDLHEAITDFVVRAQEHVKRHSLDGLPAHPPLSLVRLEDSPA